MSAGARRTGLLVLGSVNLDVMIHLDALPTGGQTVLGGDAVLRPGGKGANQAVAAALAGAHVSIAGRVGDDERASTVRAALAGAGVDTEHLRTTPGRSTGLAVVLVTRDGENAIVVSPGANHGFRTDDVDELRELVAHSAMVLMQLELPVEVVARTCALAVEVETPVVLNLAPASDVPEELLTRLAILVVNRSEAEHLVGHPLADLDALHRAAAQLHSRGPAAVVVTAGGEGAVLADEHGTSHFAAKRVEVVDTSGAGDAFVGVLAARVTQGRTLVDALRDAALAAAAAVQVDGAQLTELSFEPERST
jgi:ribokinase